MIASTLITLSAFVLSVSADQIISRNPSFISPARGCITAPLDYGNGEPIVIHDCSSDSAEASSWTVTWANGADSKPSPISINGDKCIDVTDGVNADGTFLQIWTCVEGNSNQQWVNRLDGTFQWSGTNKCIDLTNGVITDGNQLQIWTCAPGDLNQAWASPAEEFSS